MTTGIYCLPSCAARPPKPQNVRLFTTEAEAQGRGPARLQTLPSRSLLQGRGREFGAVRRPGGARSRPIPTTSRMPRRCRKAAGVSLTKLGDLFRDHAHLAPAAWLRRARVKQAAQELLAATDKVAEIGFGAGFESESVFHRQFLAQMRMTPGAYRALDGAQVFLLQLPPSIGPRKSLAITAAIPKRSARKAKATASGKPCRPRMARRWWKSASSRARPG